MIGGIIVGESYVIAHDIGTSSTKTVLIDFNGNVCATSSNSYETYMPHPGWVEQEPDDYWRAVVDGTHGVLEKSGVSAKDIAAIVSTTQAMGIIPIGKDGSVLRPNITWVDGRAEIQAHKIMRKVGGEKIFKSIIGIPIMGKDVVAKLLWFKEEEPELYRKTDVILDVNGFVKYRMTGAKVMDWTGASSYGFDLKKKDYIRFIFKAIGFEDSKLAHLVTSIDKVGELTKEAAEKLHLLEGIPVFGGCDDVQSAAVGAGALDDGDAHIYLGTSAWLCVATSKNLKHCNGANVLQSAHPQRNVIVGITEAAGSCIQWIADQFFKHEQDDPNITNIFDIMDETVKNVPPGAEYLICTPWMMGERCPVSTTTTRATMFNLSQSHRREHMMRAVYEGVGYNLRWIMDNFKKDYKVNIKKLRIIGGGSMDKEWMQIVSDITQKEIETIENPRVAGAIGAAFCALVGLGVYEFDDITRFITVDKKYLPQKGNQEIYDELFKSYKEIYFALRKAYTHVNSKRFSS